MEVILIGLFVFLVRWIGPANYGIFFLGMDVFHTGGTIVRGLSRPHLLIVCNRYQLEWKTVDGLRKPYLWDENAEQWILINNLHVHSKDLKSGLSV